MSPEQIRFLCGTIVPFNANEKKVWAARKGIAHQEYEIQHRLIYLTRRVLWFVGLAHGTTDASLEWTHKQLEGLIVQTIGLFDAVKRAAEADLLDAESVQCFFLKNRSAHKYDPNKARAIHAQMVRSGRFREYTLRFLDALGRARAAAARGELGDLGACVNVMLSTLRDLSTYISYTPEAFDRMMEQIQAAYCHFPKKGKETTMYGGSP